MIGYVRVSSSDQNLNLQLDALKPYNLHSVYEEKASAAASQYAPRPVLDHLLHNVLEPGDTLVVYKLDRLSRSLVDLLTITKNLHVRGIYFKSITEALDTTTPVGELMFNVLASLAEFERSMIKERCKAGIKAARLRGQHLGRKEMLDPELKQEILDRAEIHPVTQVAEQFGVSREYIYYHLRRRRNERAAQNAESAHQ